MMAKQLTTKKITDIVFYMEMNLLSHQDSPTHNLPTGSEASFTAHTSSAVFNPPDIGFSALTSLYPWPHQN